MFFLPLLAILVLTVDKWRLYKRSLTFAEASDALETRDGLDARFIFEVLAASALYFTTSPALILLNKHILVELEFPFPIFVSSLTNIAVMSRVLVGVRLWSLQSTSCSTSDYLRLVVPLSILSVVSLTTGNIANIYLSVAFTQMLKCLTLLFVMAFGVLLAVEELKKPLVISVCTISVGMAIVMSDSFLTGSGSVGAGAVVRSPHQTYGLCMMLLSVVVEAVRSVFAQMSVQRLSFVDAIYRTSPVMSAAGLLLLLPVESAGLSRIVMTPSLARALGVAMVLGTLCTMSSWWLTVLVGSLSVKILVNLRNIVLVLVSVYVFGEACTNLQYFGYSVALLGTMLYDRSKQQPLHQVSCTGSSAQTPAKIGV